MIKYNSENHFKFHNVKVFDKERMILYFKRMPIEQDESDNLYNGLNQLIMKERIEQTKQKVEEGKQVTSSVKMDQGELPKNRTLIIMNFDSPFDRKFIAKVFKLCGIIRRVYVGSMKVAENGKKKLLHVGLVVFKNEYDLTKCFDIEYFQQRINNKFKSAPISTNYEKKLLQNYEVVDEKKNQIIEEAQQEGYQIAMNKFGDFETNIEKPKFEKRNWVGRNKNKTKKNVDMDEIEQVIQGLDDNLPHQKKKDILKMQKQQLQQQFQQDIENLRQKQKKVKE
ncbi:unnamed protein product (macronuclear) [Paramecium tetraurelia]|uniref:RRM domain-containing protein n=1 Tax=Paramecium tetraurelia TaxID=5888 RepID=A0DX35_PARTE|nr:uncharacterized protein GSPATT00021234001 [Paramecium tetraurelia]CAK87602.1 unnamed protein product [Paramecium tetraurelia]|eukprot:XP_001454999.1 hypothetical protein (macronuclear) [Paramecium tetraurelia strain d4-2]